MNKPSLLSWINFVLLILMLCSTFGVINPKQWIEDFQNTSGIEVKTPIQKIQDTLNEYGNKLNYLKNNEYKYALKSDINNISNNLQLKLDESKITFKEYYEQLNYHINENKKLIQRLTGSTNISEQIKYWQNKYNNQNCNWEHKVNSNLCVDIRNRISNLQQKLPY